MIDRIPSTFSIAEEPEGLVDDDFDEFSEYPFTHSISMVGGAPLRGASLLSAGNATAASALGRRGARRRPGAQPPRREPRSHLPAFLSMKPFQDALATEQFGVALEQVRRDSTASRTQRSGSLRQEALSRERDTEKKNRSSSEEEETLNEGIVRERVLSPVDALRDASVALAGHVEASRERNEHDELLLRRGSERERTIYRRAPAAPTFFSERVSC